MRLVNLYWIVLFFACARESTKPPAKESLALNSISDSADYVPVCNQILARDILLQYQEGSFGIETVQTLNTWLCGEGDQLLEDESGVAREICESIERDCVASDREVLGHKSDLALLKQARSEASNKWRICMQEKEGRIIASEESQEAASPKLELSDCEKFRVDSLKANLISESDYRFLAAENYIPYFSAGKMKGYLACAEDDILIQ